MFQKRTKVAPMNEDAEKNYQEWAVEAGSEGQGESVGEVRLDATQAAALDRLAEQASQTQGRKFTRADMVLEAVREMLARRAGE